VVDIAALNEAEVRAIYRARYIKDPGFADITDDALHALTLGMLGLPAAASELLSGSG
jgi:hypothetical protein